jgi:hypothetical protein
MTTSVPHQGAGSSGSGNKGQPRPYAPAWVSHFTHWVGRLPGPGWSFYLGAMLVLMLALHAAQWVEGVLPLGRFSAPHLFMPAMVTFILAMIHYSDRRAAAALATLRPALKASEEEYEGLHYQLTTQPALPALLACLAIVLFIGTLEFIGDPPEHFKLLANAPVSRALSFFVYYLGWWNFGALLHHTVHQLRQINRIYTDHTRVSVFRMGPLYAFSTVSAVTAVGLVVPSYGWTALNPQNLSDPLSVVIVLLMTVLAVAAFVWPLLGIHGLLVKEKGRLLDQVSLRLEATMAESHKRLDEGDLKGIGDLNTALTGLEMQRNALRAIPTWPWQPETVRLLITALALPLGLWVAQFILQRVLGS